VIIKRFYEERRDLCNELNYIFLLLFFIKFGVKSEEVAFRFKSKGGSINYGGA
jgi:hypothetical protein